MHLIHNDEMVFFYKICYIYDGIMIGGIFVAIRPEGTPNPNAVKFTSDTVIFEGNDSVSVMPGDTSEHEVLNELMKLEGVDNVFGYKNFITVNKQFDVEWDHLLNKIIEVIESYGY